jgi:hypothetical protein
VNGDRVKARIRQSASLYSEWGKCDKSKSKGGEGEKRLKAREERKKA